MPLESICAGCGKRLRVADEYVGKKARCPSCGEIYTVPADDDERRGPESFVETSPHAASPFPHESDQWYLQTPEQRIYGPVDQSQLDRWAREGRVSGDCFLRSGAQGGWQCAEEVYGFLTSTADPAARVGNPFKADAAHERAFASDGHAARRPSYVEPHRGVLILVLGILGWVISCPLLSVIAWWLGTTDLYAMRDGRMDPSGQGLTQAGQILGMVHTIVSILVVAVVLFVFLVMAAVHA